MTTKANTDSATAMKMYEESYAKAFNLETGPLIRGMLAKLGEEEYLLFIIVHHIAMDGQSHYIFYRDLWQVYNSMKNGLECDTLKTPGLNYIDYVLETRQKPLINDVHLNYWLSKLNNFTFEEPSTIPGDKHRPVVFTGNGKRLTYLLEESELTVLFGQGTQFTIFQKLLALVYLTMFTYSGEEDLIVGTPVSGRYDRKYKDIVGFFVNQIPLRIKIDPSETFLIFLQRVSRVVMQGLEHCDFQFDRLVKELNMPRDTSSSPIFNVNLCYHSEAMKSEGFPNELSVERVLIHNETAKWDLYFDFVRETEGKDRRKLRFTLEYYSDLYSDQYAQQIGGNFVQMMQKLSLNENLNLQTLRQKTIVNNMAILRGLQVPLGSKSIAEILFESMTAASDRTALVHRNNAISYATLLDTSLKLGALLRNKANLKKLDRIGLLLESNTPHAVEAVLACLFTNLVFLPLDIESPVSRIEFICKKSNCKAIIFTRNFLGLAEKLRWFPGSPIDSIICVDSSLQDCSEINTEAGLMSTELWDTVCKDGQNPIEKGGWVSSFTRKPFPNTEMLEYSQNVVSKLKPYLIRNSTVLEIGCGSGLTAEVISPFVKSYLACDPSQEMVENLRMRSKWNVQAFQASALQVKAKLLGNQKFDLIIVNSVIHCFPTHSYFFQMLRGISEMLKEDGVLFLGDIMNWEQKSELEEELGKFKANNPLANTKIHFSNELFLTESFLKSAFDNIGRFKQAEVLFSKKIHTVTNELTKYRFDVVVKLNGKQNSSAHLSPRLPGHFDLTDIQQLSPISNLAQIDLEDDCYILYTSGTTGLPKEVTIGHAALLNYIRWAARRYQMDSNTVMPLFSKLTFDFTLTSLLCPIYVGGTVKIFESFETSYKALSKSQNLTHIKLSPLQLEVMSKYCSDESIELIHKYFVIGGEELTLNQLTGLKSVARSTFTIFNEYGPTEATVGCICSEIPSEEINADYKVRIGEPIDNTGVVCLSKDIHLIQKGVVGTCGLFGVNICKLSSTNPACRLLNLLTEDGAEDETLVYITDDLISINNETVQHYGRKSGPTVKVSNIRVDLKEVQKCVSSIAGVQAAWPMTLRSDSNNQELIGILVQSAQASLSLEYIKEYAAACLPRTWIPKVWKLINENPPYNRNGKVSYPEMLRILKKELEQSKTSRLIQEGEKHSDVTRAIMNGFMSVLNLNFNPALNANFFDLGGDSIAGIYLVRYLNKRKINVSYDDLYRNSTINQLAELAELRGRTFAQNPQCRDQCSGSFKPTQISLDYLNSFSTAKYLFVLSALGRFTIAVPTLEKFEKCVRSLVQHHEALRSKFKAVDGTWNQIIQPIEEFRPIVREFEIQETTVNSLGQEPEFYEVWTSLAEELNICDGPISAFALIQYGGHIYFVFVVHHLVVDIVSSDILLDDFAMLLSDAEIQIPDSVQISSFCGVLSTTSVNQDELAYWNQVDAKLLPKPRPAVAVEATGSDFFCFETSSETVLNVSTNLGVSPEAVVLSAMTFGLFDEEGSLAICMEGHGRNIAGVDSSRTVGWLTSRYPVILESSRKDFETYTRKVAAVLSNIPNRGLNYGVLKRNNILKENICNQPDTMFVYLGQLDRHSSIFGEGEYQIEAMPWIEVILEQLTAKNSDFLERIPREFGLELISWTVGSKHKFGCLYEMGKYQGEILKQRIQLGITALEDLQKLQNKIFNSECILFPSFDLPDDFAANLEQEFLEYSVKVSASFPAKMLQTWFDSQLGHGNQYRVLILLSLSNLKTIVDILAAKQDANVILVLINMGSEIPAELRQFNGIKVLQLNINQKYIIQGHGAQLLTEAGYSHLSSYLKRQLLPLLEPKPFKLIAVDADNTLWNGEAANGFVTFDPRHIYLQEFLLKKKQEGYLLALLSKNALPDVEYIFQENATSIPLSLQDFVEIVCNWNAKSENLKKIASTLNLNVISFVFLDDSILECASMAVQLPDVLTIQIPDSLEDLQAIIASVWALDASEDLKTAVSSQRTMLYATEAKRRQKLRDSDANITTILQSWKMTSRFMLTSGSKVGALHPNIYSRANELLHRSNQFKLNSKLLSLKLCSTDENVLFCTLEDDFGDLGLVSVMIFANEEEETRVKQWVISCRALGRGMEDAIFSYLHAKFPGRKISFEFEDSGRNGPMKTFISSVDGPVKSSEDNLSGLIEVVEGDIEDQRIEIPQPKPEAAQEKNCFTKACAFDDQNRVNLLVKSWPQELRLQKGIKYLHILKYIEEDIPVEAGSDPNLDDVVARLWKKQTNNSSQRNHNFFQSGGTSMKAIYLLSELANVTGRKVELLELYENPHFEDFLEIVRSKIPSVDNTTAATNESSNQLSIIQKEFAFLQQLTPTSTAYTESVTVQVSAASFSRSELEDLLKSLISKFPSLSVGIGWNSPEFLLPLINTIASEFTWRFQEVSDFQNLICNGVALTVEDAKSSLSQMTPVFQLCNNHLFKLCCIDVPTEAIALITIFVHHILIDHVSLQMLGKYIRDYFTDGRTYASKSDGPTFQQYTFLENKYLNSTEKSDAEQVLRTKLQNVDDSNPNPFYGTWDSRTVYEAEERTDLIDWDIEPACKAYNTNPFNFYLGAYLLTLRRYLGSNQLQTRIPITTRTHEFQDSIGPFLNVVPFVCKLNQDSEVEELFSYIRNEFNIFQRYSWFPFNQLLDASNETNFGNMFSYYEALEVDEIRIPGKHAKLPFSLDVFNTQFVVLTWARGLIDSSVGQNFLKNFVNTCKILINANERSGKTFIRELDILCTDELSKLKNFVRLTPAIQEERYFNLYQLFKRNCSLNPAKIAIWEDANTKYTYADLDKMVENIASNLRFTSATTISSEKPVLLLMEKNDVRCIACILGIWKLRAYFVPLDADYQEKSFSVISSCYCIISNIERNRIHQKLAESAIPLISLEGLVKSNDKTMAFASYPEPQSAISPAYMMMTSGSTGPPKKCIIRHQSLLLLAASWKHEYGFKDNSELNVFQWAPFAFDVFMGDFTKALILTNGSLTLVPFKERLDVQRLRELMCKTSVTFAEVTPQFAQIVSQTEPDAFSNLEHLVLGSDTLHWSTVDQIRSCLPKTTKLYNSYGLTETTVDSTLYEIPQTWRASTRPAFVPIGRPMININVSIRDPETHLPVPIGATGVLAISGCTVGSGDIHTVQIDGETTYLTGDFAAWLPCGNIEFKGRNEKSVLKIRGFRLHCGDIVEACSKLKIGSKGCIPFLLQLGTETVLNLAIVRNQNVESTTIRKQLSTLLPHYMIPQVILQVEAFPLTSNGKVDMNALRNLAESEFKAPTMKAKSAENLTDLETLLLDELAVSCHRAKSTFDVTWNLRDQGLNSLNLMNFSNALMQMKIKGFDGIVDLFNYPSIQLLAEKLAGKSHENTPEESLTAQNTSTPKTEKVCIVGLAFQLPGNCSTLTQFWKQISSSNSAIKDFPEKRRLDIAGVAKTDNFAKAGYLEEIDQFDNTFFKISPNEAKHMCPEQRLFLQVGTEALIDSGFTPGAQNASKIGVFATPSEIQYDLVDSNEDGVARVGRQASMIPTRLSYAFDLTGGNYVIDTACSSALSAINKAVSAIKSGSCDTALVGGVNLMLVPEVDGIFGSKSIQSPDFTCRPFDKAANGTVSGEGVFAFVLKKMSEAKRDKNHIYCTIEACATNSVGRGNGITAPSVASQVQVLEAALKSANLTPEDIDFVETHGSGTVLGDQIELSALESVYRRRKKPLSLGATKPVFGHLDSCAGFLGLLKTICCLQKNSLPAILHLNDPSPHFNTDLFRAEATALGETEDWTTTCYSGLSAFGISGTNVHVILSYTKQPVNPISLQECQFLLPITNSNLSTISMAFKDHVHDMTSDSSGITSIEDICATQALNLLSVQNIRQVLILKVSTLEELLQKLTDISQNGYAMFSKDIIDVDETMLQQIAGSMPLSKRSPGLPQVTFLTSRFWPEVTGQLISSGIEKSKSEATSFEAVLQNRYSDCRELLRSVNLAQPAQISKHLEDFCTSLIVDFLSSTPLAKIWKIGSSLKSTEALHVTGINARYEKLLYVMLRHLHEAGLIHFQDKGNTCFQIKKMPFSGKTSEELAQNGASNFPAYADCFKFPLYCSKFYRDVLLGDMSPLSVIYPKGNLNFMNQFTKLGDELGNVYYDMYMQTIAEYVLEAARHRPGKTFRILEVGAGMGFVTRQLAPKILKNTEDTNIQYWFTDLGKAFVENARKEFHKFGARMQFAVFDITLPLKEQGIQEEFDLIISYNVIHTTSSIVQSLTNLQKCINADGYVCIIESSKNDTWATLAWGLLDGWWYFTDYALRKADPMLTRESWANVLRLLFSNVTICPEVEDVEKVMYVCSNNSNLTILESSADWWKSEEIPANLNEDNTEPEPMQILNDLTHDRATAGLMEIWKECLGVREVAEDDVFQELGGDSLLVIQMIQKIKQVFGIQLEIAHAFAHPKLSSLSRLMTNMWFKQNKSVAALNLTNPGTIPNEIKTNSLAMLLFPGQGSQKLTMCESMLGNSEAIKVFQRTKEILNIDVLARLADEPDCLQKTDFIQLALFVSSMAKIAQIRSEDPKLLEMIEAVGGLSVGEFAALVFAEAIQFEDALQIVHVRGRAMQIEVEKHSTKMVSVFGPTTDQLKSFILEHYPELSICTYLADNQHTVGGPSEACERLLEHLLDDNINVQLGVVDVRILRVGGAFHSKYMRTAYEEVAPLIDRMKIANPKCAVIMNVNGHIVTSAEEIRYNLKQQILQPVQWKTAMKSAVEQGILKFIEVSPSCVLAPLLNRIQFCKEAGCDAQFIRI